MDEQQKWLQWIKKVPVWVSGAIGLATTIISFVVLFRENWYLGTVILITMLPAGLLLLCLFVTFSKSPPLIEGGRGVYRFEKHRALALIGIGFIVVFVIALLIFKPSRSLIAIALVGTTTPTPMPTPTSTPMPTQTPSPTPTLTSTPVPTQLLIPIPTTPQISQVLISRSDMYYRLEITVHNPLENEILVKKISMSTREEEAACTPPPTGVHPRLSYRFSDTFVLQRVSESGLELEGHVYETSQDEYGYEVTGSITTDRCGFRSLTAEFDCSFILPPSQFSFLYLLIPRELRIIGDSNQDYMSTFTNFCSYVDPSLEIQMNLFEQEDITFEVPLGEFCDYGIHMRYRES